MIELNHKHYHSTLVDETEMSVDFAVLAADEQDSDKSGKGH